MARTTAKTTAPATSDRMTAFLSKPSANQTQRPTEDWGHVQLASEYEGGARPEFLPYSSDEAARDNGLGDLVPGEPKTRRATTRRRATAEPATE